MQQKTRVRTCSTPKRGIVLSKDLHAEADLKMRRSSLLVTSQHKDPRRNSYHNPHNPHSLHNSRPIARSLKHNHTTNFRSPFKINFGYLNPQGRQCINKPVNKIVSNFTSIKVPIVQNCIKSKLNFTYTNPLCPFPKDSFTPQLMTPTNKIRQRSKNIQNQFCISINKQNSEAQHKNQQGQIENFQIKCDTFRNLQINTQKSQLDMQTQLKTSNKND